MFNVAGKVYYKNIIYWEEICGDYWKKRGEEIYIIYFYSSYNYTYKSFLLFCVIPTLLLYLLIFNHLKIWKSKFQLSMLQELSIVFVINYYQTFINFINLNSTSNYY